MHIMISVTNIAVKCVNQFPLLFTRKILILSDVVYSPYFSFIPLSYAMYVICFNFHQLYHQKFISCVCQFCKLLIYKYNTHSKYLNILVEMCENKLHLIQHCLWAHSAQNPINRWQKHKLSKSHFGGIHDTWNICINKKRKKIQVILGPKAYS